MLRLMSLAYVCDSAAVRVDPLKQAETYKYVSCAGKGTLRGAVEPVAAS